VGQCRLACAVRYRFSRADATDLANFIQPMLHFVPESRATARVRIAMLLPIARALGLLFYPIVRPLQLTSQSDENDLLTS
jgi:hypothetical protein